MQKYNDKDEETEHNKNIIQIKFDSINQIHQTNASRIITVATNDV